MKTTRRGGICPMICAAALMTITDGVQPYARADSAPLTVPAEKTQSDEAQAAAKDIVMRMAEFLANTPQFSVNLESSHDALQESGQMMSMRRHRSLVESMKRLCISLEVLV